MSRRKRIALTLLSTGALGALLSGAACAAATPIISSAEESGRSAQRDRYVVRARPLTSPPAGHIDSGAVWSPDGKSLYFDRQDWDADDPGPVIYRIDLASGAVHRAAEGDAPSISPDGQRLAYLNAGGALMIRDLGTGEEIMAAERADCWNPPLWLDSQRLCYEVGNAVWLVRLQDLVRERVAESASRWYSWSPDRRWLAVVMGSGHESAAGEPSPLRIIDSRDGSAVTLSELDCDLLDPSWSSDSRLVAFAGEPYPRADDDETQRIYVYDVEAGQPRALTEESTDCRAPAWSPDGKRLAYARAVAGDEDQRASMICVYNRATRDAVVVAAAVGDVLDEIAWSPDGEWLSYGSIAGFPKNTLGLARADGSFGAAVARGGLFWYAWSPDSTRLVAQPMDVIGSAPLWIVEVEYERSTLSLADIERLSKVTFPKDTKVLNAELLLWLDSVVFARLEMDQAAYQQFITSSRFAGKFSETDRHGLTNDLAHQYGFELPWWGPDAIETFLAAEDIITPLGPDYQKAVVIIGLDRPDTHVVYLYWLKA